MIVIALVEVKFGVVMAVCIGVEGIGLATAKEATGESISSAAARSSGEKMLRNTELIWFRVARALC